MKTILFEIIKQKKVKLDIPLDIIRKYPLHYSQLYEAQKTTLLYEYDPCGTINEEKYIEYLKNKFKKEYNAYSVTVGFLEKQLKE